MIIRKCIIILYQQCFILNIIKDFFSNEWEIYWISCFLIYCCFRRRKCSFTFCWFVFWFLQTFTDNKKTYFILKWISMLSIYNICRTFLFGSCNVVVNGKYVVNTHVIKILTWLHKTQLYIHSLLITAIRAKVKKVKMQKVKISI